jgi:pimeloyl-ACP methyl ester carboxylesterase
MQSAFTADVTESVKLARNHHISMAVFPPADPGKIVPLLFCLPGGSYTKSYWHLEVPGLPGYSFAQHMASSGMLVVTVDHLGTGESSRHPRAIDLTPEVVAAANATAFTEVAARAAEGTLVEGLPAVTIGPSVGVGHSMGAMLAVFQQSLFGSFDAIAPLGYGTVGPIATPEQLGMGGSLPSRESVMAAAATGAFDEMPPLDRGAAHTRHHFYWDDVPEQVMAADDQTITNVPGVTGLLSIVPFIASDHARRVGCPVFIGLGERDSTCDHHDEPRAYASSNDITLYILPRSAHCHNSAGTRHLLWDRLSRWIKSLSA